MAERTGACHFGLHQDISGLRVGPGNAPPRGWVAFQLLRDGSCIRVSRTDEPDTFLVPSSPSLRGSMDYHELFELGARLPALDGGAGEILDKDLIRKVFGIMD